MKKDYLLNTIAGLLNAAEAVIISMIITRTTGLTDAGYVTIAFAVGNLLMTIGKYGVYGFQVTDYDRTYPFSSYFYARIITVLFMFFCLCGYLLYGHTRLHYTSDKIYIVLFIGLIYTIEAFEDLIKAHCQYIGKLYVGALMFIIRWVVIILSFGITIILTHNTSKSLGISLVFSLLTFFITYYIVSEKYLPKLDIYKRNNILSCKQYTNIIHILTTCFPLFLTSFLSFYIVNSSKYALEKYMDAKTQAEFGFITMPVFAIELLNSFIYQPQLVSLTNDFKNNNPNFRSRILRQYMIILFITITCILGAYFIGIPVLTLLYHTDLGNYKLEMLILLIGGGFLAVSGYQSAILTIMRKQEYLLLGYIPVSVLAFFFVGPTVKEFGTTGAAFSYQILIFILSIIYEVFIRKVMVDVS